MRKCLLLTLRSQSRFQLLNGGIESSLEAWQISLTRSHHVYEDHDLFVVLIKCFIALNHVISELLESLSLL